MKSYISRRQSIAQKFRNELKKNPTPEEIKMNKKLRRLFGNGILFQKSFITGPNIYIVDFYIPKPYKIVIEVDGWHHSRGEQLEKDRIRDKWLWDKKGVSVLRVKNSEVDAFYLKETVKSILCRIENQNTS